MRQWMVDPSWMCNSHLLGEHCEHHSFLGTMRLRKKIDGYLQNNLLEPLSLKTRHDELAVELLIRGMKHLTPMSDEETMEAISYLTSSQREWKIDREKSMKLLLSRCPLCRSKEEACWQKLNSQVVQALHC